MSNANETAYPRLDRSYPASDGDYYLHESAGGLTKREEFAKAAMKGFCAAANPMTVRTLAHEIAACAVAQADALLAELERTK